MYLGHTRTSPELYFVFIAVIMKCVNDCYRWSQRHSHSNSHCYLEVPYLFLTPSLSKVLSLLVGFGRDCLHRELFLLLSCQYTKNIPNEIFITYTSHISSLETKDKPIRSTVLTTFESVTQRTTIAHVLMFNLSDFSYGLRTVTNNFNGTACIVITKVGTGEAGARPPAGPTPHHLVALGKLLKFSKRALSSLRWPSHFLIWLLGLRELFLRTFLE